MAEASTQAASQRRYIEVPLSAGDKVQVRVITLHPDDKEMQRLWYRADELWTAKEKVREKALAAEDAAARLRLLDEVAELSIALDERRTDLMRAVLADKLSGEQITELISKCNSLDTLQIFEAANNVEPWRVALLAKQTEQPSNAAKSS